MPHWCDCTLRITGPNRQAVLDTLKGEPYEGEQVYFEVEHIIPRPTDLGDNDNWQEWSYEHWGCRNVYHDRQSLYTEDNADVIAFYTPWCPPCVAIVTLSEMFPENTFVLKGWGDDVPLGTAVYKKGKCSRYFTLPNYNSTTGKTATLYEIFCAVLDRLGDKAVEEALEAVNKAKPQILSGLLENVIRDGSNYDPALDVEAKAILAHRTYDNSMLAADEKRIADHLAGVREYKNNS